MQLRDPARTPRASRRRSSCTLEGPSYPDVIMATRCRTQIGSLWCVHMRLPQASASAAVINRRIALPSGLGDTPFAKRLNVARAGGRLLSTHGTCCPRRTAGPSTDASAASPSGNVDARCVRQSTEEGCDPSAIQIGGPGGIAARARRRRRARRPPTARTPILEMCSKAASLPLPGSLLPCARVPHNGKPLTLCFDGVPDERGRSSVSAELGVSV